MKPSIWTILGGIFLNLLRYWAGSLLTLVVAHHWVTTDQQHQLTVWFDGWSAVFIKTLIAATPPFLFSVYVMLKMRFKEAAARMLPQGSTHDAVKQVLDNSTYGQIVTLSPSPAVVRDVVRQQ